MTRIQIFFCIMIGIFSLPIGANNKANIFMGNSYTDGHPCTCKKVIGRCQGYIDNINTTTEGGKSIVSSQTTFRIHSQTTQCAKVNYFIDGTPSSRIFAQAPVWESGWGTSKKVNVKYQSCEVCATDDEEIRNFEEIDSLLDAAQKKGHEKIKVANQIAHEAYTSALDRYQASSKEMTSSSILTPSTSLSSNFGGSESCTDEELTKKLEPILNKMQAELNQGNMGVCRSASKIKELHQHILRVTQNCKPNTPGIKQLREQSIASIKQADEQIRSTVGSRNGVC